MLYKTMAIYGRTMKHYELGVHATIKNQVLLMFISLFCHINFAVFLGINCAQPSTYDGNR